MISNLVIGMGQIGRAVAEVLGDDYQNVILKKDLGALPKTFEVDILHICTPYSNDFKDIVRGYMKEYDPSFTIVYSTVPIGTCKELGVAHSPVEGKHPDLAQSIRMSPRWIGCDYEADREAAANLWTNVNLEVKALTSSDYTEFLKIRSTSKYGINIAWTKYEKSIADDIGMDFGILKDFDQDYNELYQNLGLSQYQRYILDPPEGPIGGHCVWENAQLLTKQYPSALLDEITKLR